MVVAVGSALLTVTKVSDEDIVPEVVNRTRFWLSAHQANSGSFTEYLPALLVRAKMGAFPFGEIKRMRSRKFLGRSSVPQSPVPRRPAMPDMIQPPMVDRNRPPCQRRGQFPLLGVVLPSHLDELVRTARGPDGPGLMPDQIH